MTGRLPLPLAAISVVALMLWFNLPRGHHSPKLQNTVRVGFAVGEHAPDSELHSLDGRAVRLSDLRGKPVLLNFWATWCAPCRIEMPWLVELDEKYRALGLQIVGVSMDDASATQQVAAFVRERSVRYEILLGNSATADAYGGVRFMPQSFFLDSEGTITGATIGLTTKKDLEDGAETLLGGSGAQRLAQGVVPANR